MKKLLQINTNVGWNAPGSIAENIGMAAMAHGWESHIAYGRNVGRVPQSASTLYRMGNSTGIIAHGLQTRILDRHGLGSAHATRGLLEHIRRLKPDIIHLHNIHGYYLNYPLLFGFLADAGIPVVWTFHDCWPFTGHCAYYSDKCDRWKTGCHHCLLRGEYPASFVADRSRKNYAMKMRVFTSVPGINIVTASEWLASEVAQSFLRECRTLTIHNGVSIPQIDGGIPRRKLVIAVASVWDSIKGLDDFVALRQELSPEIEMMAVGLTAAQIRSLPPGIEGRPRTADRDELYRLYASASVLANTSHHENLPTVNLEAQACGTPVVAFDSGGTRETICPDTGHLVHRGDVKAMARSIMSLLGRDSRQLAHDSRDFIIENFGLSASCSRYLNLYDSLLQ